MPYDDSNIKKMIKYQTERKVGFSKSKKVSDSCKSLIHAMLEASVKNRASLSDIQSHPWLCEERQLHDPNCIAGGFSCSECTVPRPAMVQPAAVAEIPQPTCNMKNVNPPATADPYQRPQNPEPHEGRRSPMPGPQPNQNGTNHPNKVEQSNTDNLSDEVTRMSLA